MKPEERIHSLLVHCAGIDAALTAPAICKRLGWPKSRDREVRRLIARHANNDWLGVLCAVPGTGYFFASNLDEIVTYRKYLVSLKKAAGKKIVQLDDAAKHEGFNLQEAA